MFTVTGVSSAEHARDYCVDLDADFGWYSHDGDNSLGDCFLRYSGVYESTPWVGVIRPSDMQLMYDEPDGGLLDIEAIAVEMAGY
jgi:hypothetical protein